MLSVSVKHFSLIEFSDILIPTREGLTIPIFALFIRTFQRKARAQRVKLSNRLKMMVGAALLGFLLSVMLLLSTVIEQWFQIGSLKVLAEGRGLEEVGKRLSRMGYETGLSSGIAEGAVVRSFQPVVRLLH
jgi:hypothetical protein